MTAKIVGGARVGAVLTALALLVAGGVAMAETKSPPKKGEPKQPAPAPAPAPQAQPQPLPPIVYSPWTKVCPPQPPNAPAIKPVCLTLKEGRLETGQFVAGAAMIEQQGEERKLMRVTMPLGLQLAPGTRVTLDAEQPIAAPFVICVPNGCMADYQIDVGFIGKLKKGQQLILQGVDQQNQVVSIPLPLTDFAKAIDGPPTDPAEYEARQKAEWEKRLKDRQATPPKQ